ncbi:C-GCAxxG-C-C family (seleno)protein [Anaeromyxobacter terrae]|uniref:C-GCAxxG-C-C family (seleno)protein n=1 Tax=Anaeromyxobacter terrae TaxID=2925406 RepID=UPI001F57CF1A|nr:C-GCAxxG-C-C family protein [Anaeromyxobacter sp. SG22]
MFDKVTGRRRFATVVGAVAGTAVLGGGASAAAAVKHAKADAHRKLATVPWPYVTLDPDRVASRAFSAYEQGHCMFGAFDALVGSVADKLGDPYASFPFDVMKYGAGGVNGWATICGALNGSAAAFELLSREPGPLVDALFGWYEREPLPDLVLKTAAHPNVQSIAGSPLCHTSVSRWCETSGKKSFSAERKERCGILTASVARRAAELLNAQAAKRPLPVTSASAGAGCARCHEEGGSLEDTRSKMDCQGCHFHLGGEHPSL